MITREEYNKALDIVEEYNKQLFIGGVGSSFVNKTKISEWEKLWEASGMLSNNIIKIMKLEKGEYVYVEYIEDITKRCFFKTRGLGKVAWNEFIKLRGY